MERKIMPTTWFLRFVILIIFLSFIISEKEFIPFPVNHIGWLPVIFGVLLNLWTDNLFKKQKTTVKPYEAPSLIIKTGPFCISRNPMYPGMFLILAGTAWLLKSLILLLIPLIFALIMDFFYIRKEELNLNEIFGTEFLKYKQKVKKWL